jgi:hypothetical protein
VTTRGQQIRELAQSIKVEARVAALRRLAMASAAAFEHRGCRSEQGNEVIDDGKPKSNH